MPYTPLQKQYLDAMGLVPWALRKSCVATEQAEPVVENAADCSVLLMFSSAPSEATQPLSSTENRLLLDMFGAIKLEDSSVARRFVSLDTSADVSQAIEPFMSGSVKAVLIAVHQADEIQGDEAASSRLLANHLNVPVWQIPHPSWLQQDPVLKRRAWNVLKAVRESLQATVPA